MKASFQPSAGRAKFRRSRAGQILTEYVVLTGLLVGTVVILAVVLWVFRNFGGRILDLIAYEYP